MEITKRANTDIVLNAFMNHIVIGMKSVSIICVKKILVPLDYLVLWQSGLARQVGEIVVLDQDDTEVLVVVLDQEDIEVLVVVLDQEDIKVLVVVRDQEDIEVLVVVPDQDEEKREELKVMEDKKVLENDIPCINEKWFLLCTTCYVSII